MAQKLKLIKEYIIDNRKTIFEAFIYAIMLILICIYFKGNGQFIYEMVI